MKESLNRIVAWAKAHPYAAVGIVGGIVFLAWWMSKKSPSAGVSIDTGEMQNTSPDLSGLGSSDSSASWLGSGSAIGIPSLPIPAESVPVNTRTRISDLEPLPSDPFMMDSGLGSFDLSSLPSLSSFGGLQIPGSSPVTGTGRLGSGSAVRGTAPAATATATPSSSFTPPTRSTIQSPAQETINTRNMTPAMLVGKGRHFTGTYNGVTYVNGYPVTGYQNLNGIQTATLPGGRAVSVDMLNSGSGSGFTGGSTRVR